MADTPQTEVTHTCPKCNSSMEKGFTYGSGYWVDSISGSRGIGSSLELKLNNAFAVDSFKCRKCGFIEQYAETK